MKWIAPALAYLAVGLGTFQLRSAWGALLGFHFAIIVCLLISRPDIPIKMLVTHNNIQWTVLSILLAGSSGIALYLVWDFLGFAHDLSAQVEALGLTSSNWIPFIAYFTLVNPLIEEYFWRGFLGSTTKGLHPSDLLYSGFHALILAGKVQMGLLIFALTVLVLAGWFWRQLARADGGLLAPMLGHMAADFTILMAVYLNLQG